MSTLIRPVWRYAIKSQHLMSWPIFIQTNNYAITNCTLQIGSFIKAYVQYLRKKSYNRLLPRYCRYSKQNKSYSSNWVVLYLNKYDVLMWKYWFSNDALIFQVAFYGLYICFIMKKGDIIDDIIKSIYIHTLRRWALFMAITLLRAKKSRCPWFFEFLIFRYNINMPIM